MLVRLFFILAASTIPVSILFNQEASGILVAFLFMLLGAILVNQNSRRAEEFGVNKVF